MEGEDRVISGHGMKERRDLLALGGGAAFFLLVSLLIQAPGLGAGAPATLRLAVAGCAFVAFAAVLLARASFHPKDVGGRTWGVLAFALLSYVLGYAASIAEANDFLPRGESLGTAEVLWLAGMALTALALYGNMLHLNVVLGGRGLVAAIIVSIAAGVVIAGGVLLPLASPDAAEGAIGKIPDALYLVLSVVIAIPAVVVPLQMGRGEISSVWLVFSLSLLAIALGDYLSGWNTTVESGYTRYGAEIYMLGYLGMGAAAAVQWGLNGAPLRLGRGGGAGGERSAEGVRRRSGRAAPGRAR